jgi:hypothetical protein
MDSNTWLTTPPKATKITLTEQQNLDEIIKAIVNNALRTIQGHVETGGIYICTFFDTLTRYLWISKDIRQIFGSKKTRKL